MFPKEKENKIASYNESIYIKKRNGKKSDVSFQIVKQTYKQLFFSFI